MNAINDSILKKIYNRTSNKNIEAFIGGVTTKSTKVYKKLSNKKFALFEADLILDKN